MKSPLTRQDRAQARRLTRERRKQEAQKEAYKANPYLRKFETERARLKMEAKLQPYRNKLYQRQMLGKAKALRSVGALKGGLTMAQALGFGYPGASNGVSKGKKGKRRAPPRYRSSNYAGFGDYGYGGNDHLSFDFNV